MTNPPRLLVDQDSGELIEQKTIEANPEKADIPRRGRKPLANSSFVMIWPAELMQMPRISSMQMAVFQSLIGAMDPKTGVVSFYLDELCEASGLGYKTTASAYVAKLVKLGYARRLRNRRVLINPNLAWRGDKGHRNIALFRWDHPTTTEEFELEQEETAAP